jgi:hypothetical protein
MLALVRRETVAITAVLSAIISLIGLTAHWSMESQGYVLSLAELVLGFVGMIGVAKADVLVPALAGILKAAVTVALSFGLHVDPALLAGIMLIVDTATALIVRLMVDSVVSKAMARAGQWRAPAALPDAA